MLGLCFPRTNKRDLPLARYRLPVNRHFASFQPDPPDPGIVDVRRPSHPRHPYSPTLVPSLIGRFLGKTGHGKGIPIFPYFASPPPALFPRTNENSWPYTMINAATVCRFMHKCACVCVADFDEFESKEGKIHTRARTYVANDRG